MSANLALLLICATFSLMGMALALVKLWRYLLAMHNDANQFRRFCRTCGGRESAFKVMAAAEATDFSNRTGLRLVNGGKS